MTPTIAKSYYKSGKLARETPFVNGLEHGVEKLYYKNGELECITTFANGERLK